MKTLVIKLYGLHVAEFVTIIPRSLFHLPRKIKKSMPVLAGSSDFPHTGGSFSSTPRQEEALQVGWWKSLWHCCQHSWHPYHVQHETLGLFEEGKTRRAFQWIITAVGQLRRAPKSPIVIFGVGAAVRVQPSVNKEVSWEMPLAESYWLKNPPGESSASWVQLCTELMHWPSHMHIHWAPMGQGASF